MHFHAIAEEMNHAYLSLSTPRDRDRKSAEAGLRSNSIS